MSYRSPGILSFHFPLLYLMKMNDDVNDKFEDVKLQNHHELIIKLFLTCTIARFDLIFIVRRLSY